MTRQNYYKCRRVRERLSVDESLVLELVMAERSRQPQLGGRKLLHLVGPELSLAGVEIGRDRFFELLGRHELLIERARKSGRTTWSGHGFGVYPNLAKDLVLSGPHQLLVSDITYIRTLEGFMYLCLVMDSFSRAIVGYDCSDSLEMSGALRALSLAIRQLPDGSMVVHHSDRGIQYACGPYIEELLKHGIGISMTEENHCYENAQAERLNGIMKQEYGLGQTLVSKASALSSVKEAVMLYNHYRPHGKLGYRKPMEVHGECAA